MEENKIPAANQAQVTESAPVSPTETKDESPQSTGEVQDPVSSQKEEKSTEDQVQESTPAEERKPTRAERRIHQLTEKLRSINDPKTFHEAQNFVHEQKTIPLITQEEMDSGEVDTAAIEARQVQRDNAIRTQIKQEVMQELHQRKVFEDTLRENLSDLESVKGKIEKDYDDRFQEVFAEQYELANMVINPMDGSKVFVPRIKASDLFNKLSSALESQAARRAAEANRAISERESMSAISPMATAADGQKDFSKLSYEEIYKDPKRIAREIEKKYGVT